METELYDTLERWLWKALAEHFNDQACGSEGGATVAARKFESQIVLLRQDASAFLLIFKHLQTRGMMNLKMCEVVDARCLSRVSKVYTPNRMKIMVPSPHSFSYFFSSFSSSAFISADSF